MNSIQRVGKLTLDVGGMLQGNVTEMRVGDRAWKERQRLRVLTNNTDRIKPIESLLAGSLSIFHVVQASLLNYERTDQPCGFSYSFQSENYAKKPALFTNTSTAPKCTSTFFTAATMELLSVTSSAVTSTFPFSANSPAASGDRIVAATLHLWLQTAMPRPVQSPPNSLSPKLSLP
jgi:hypothetical protein